MRWQSAKEKFGAAYKSLLNAQCSTAFSLCEARGAGFSLCRFALVGRLGGRQDYPPDFCASSMAARTSSLCFLTSTSPQPFFTFPLGSIRKVCRAESLATPKFITEPYFSDTSFLVFANSLNVRLSLLQTSWWLFSSCTLTPRTTAFFAWYFARSRSKLCASIVQPVVMSLG